MTKPRVLCVLDADGKPGALERMDDESRAAFAEIERAAIEHLRSLTMSRARCDACHQEYDSVNALPKNKAGSRTCLRCGSDDVAIIVKRKETNDDR